MVEGWPQDHERRRRRSIRGEGEEKKFEKGKMKDDNDSPLPASLSDGISPFLAKASMGETGNRTTSVGQKAGGDLSDRTVVEIARRSSPQHPLVLFSVWSARSSGAPGRR